LEIGMTSGLVADLLCDGASLLAVSVGMVIVTWKQVKPRRIDMQRQAERAWEDRARAERMRAEQVRFEQMRAKWARADQRRLERELRSDQARLRRSERLRSAHFVLAIAVQLLPPPERDRYIEEFRAELLDLPRNMRLRHALSLLRGVCVLRLRRGFKNTTGDAVMKKVKDEHSTRFT
jgi:hypothetical protein